MRSILAFVFFVAVLAFACESSRKSAAGSGTALKGTYWKLTELAGAPIPPPKEGVKEVFIRLSASDTTISGNGGCNGFGGNYTGGENDRVKFSHIISTMMACDGLDTENSLFRTLENVDSYTINEDTLQLNRARMAPLARFVAVKGK